MSVLERDNIKIHKLGIPETNLIYSDPNLNIILVKSKQIVHTNRRPNIVYPVKSTNYVKSC